MSTMTAKITFTFPLDSRGFQSRQCPGCSRGFKVQPGAGSPKPVAYCPYCGHAGDSWHTVAQSAYMEAVAYREVVYPQLKKVDDAFKSFGRMPNVKVKGNGPRPPSEPVQPAETEAPEMVPATFACCGETILAHAAGSPLRCVICGATEKLEGLGLQ